MNDVTPYANSVFEQPWWLELVAPGRWGEVFVKEGDEVVARMPYVLNNKHIVMPELTQTLGLWMINEYRNYQPGNTQLSKQKEIISELFLQLPRHKSFYMTFDSVNDYILPYRWMGYRYTSSFSYRIKDLSNIEAIYENFNKTAKKNIKAGKNKTDIVENATSDMMLDLLDKTFEAQKRQTPGKRESKKKYIESAIARGFGKIIIAQDRESNIHSGAFLLYDDRVCYYLLGGSDPTFRSSGAQSYVLWKAIQFAQSVSKSFDFEGSNVEGIENFFRQFGGERVTNYNVIKQSFLADCAEMAKPRIKNLIGYKN